MPAKVEIPSESSLKKKKGYRPNMTDEEKVACWNLYKAENDEKNKAKQIEKRRASGIGPRPEAKTCAEYHRTYAEKHPDRVLANHRRQKAKEKERRRIARDARNKAKHDFLVNLTPDQLESIEIEKKNSIREYQRNYREENRDTILLSRKVHYSKNKDKVSANGKIYRANNPERVAATKDAWRKANPDKIKAITARYYNSHREEIRAYALSRPSYSETDKVRHRERWDNDPQYKLRSNLRCRMNGAIKGGHKGGSAVRDLGCSIDFLKTRLESMWLPGMSWENWKLDGWHLDHILPLSKFDLTDPAQVKIACHYSNLQPLWWRDNITKGNKIG